MSKDHNQLLVTPEALAVFPNLFEPKAIPDTKGQPQGDPVYSMVMLFSPDDMQDIKKACTQLAQAKWPGRELKTLNFPFKKGDVEADKQAQKDRDGEFYRGYIVLKTKSKYQPGIVGPDKQDLLDPKAIYSGCYVRAQLNLKTYTSGVNEGVTAYLTNVMKTRDGERLIGTTAQDAFANVEGASSSTDPTAGAEEDDGMPF